MQDTAQHRGGPGDSAIEHVSRGSVTSCGLGCQGRVYGAPQDVPDLVCFGEGVEVGGSCRVPDSGRGMPSDCVGRLACGSMGVERSRAL